MFQCQNLIKTVFAQADLEMQFPLALESISAYLFLTFGEDKLFQIDRALFFSF